MSFETPAMLVTSQRDLHLSNQDLLVLMQAVLSQGQKFRFRVKGFSMMPFIRDGDVITAVPKRDHNYAVGDVIAFISSLSGHLVVHRVIAKKKAGYLIRGDGIADQCDGLIPFEHVLGQIICVERHGKRICMGFGPERFIIAGLSQIGLLVPLSSTLAVWRQKFGERLRG